VFAKRKEMEDFRSEVRWRRRRRRRRRK